MCRWLTCTLERKSRWVREETLLKLVLEGLTQRCSACVVARHKDSCAHVQVTRDKSVIKPAPGTRECKCKQQLVTRQLGPGMFQQYHKQVGIDKVAERFACSPLYIPLPAECALFDPTGL